VGRAIDPNGLVTSFTYHPRGWLSASSRHSSDGVLTTQYRYDAAGQVTRITLPDGSFLNYEYDAAQRRVAISNNAGERQSWVLDAAGNRVESQVHSATAALVFSHQQVFDALGRRLEDQGANAQRHPTSSTTATAT
jgi:YD repeat-containing protein